MNAVTQLLDVTLRQTYTPAMGVLGLFNEKIVNRQSMTHPDISLLVVLRANRILPSYAISFDSILQDVQLYFERLMLDYGVNNIQEVLFIMYNQNPCRAERIKECCSYANLLLEACRPLAIEPTVASLQAQYNGK